MRKQLQAEIQTRRLKRFTKEIAWAHAEMARRLAETRKIFRRPVYLVALHTHSIHSDGADPVAYNYEVAMKAGLDFMFATDHASLQQKRHVRRLSRASWGQEPVAGPHHIGLLHPRQLFTPRQKNFLADFQAAKKLAEFVWVPHPVGWYPAKWYPAEDIRLLWQLGDEFAMEVINGANKIFRAYDEFDAKAVAIWDRLLCAGRRVTALGGSDAHLAEDIAIVWTGVYAARCAADALIKALQAGVCFASEALLMEFSVNGCPMGASLSKTRHASVRVQFRIADAAGLKTARLIGDGRVLRCFDGKGKTLLTADFRCALPSRLRYLRLESIASDDRRAFSSPVYFGGHA